MSKRFAILLVLAPLVLVPATFVGVLRMQSLPLVRAAIPREPFEPARCTWFCHNDGCRHAPRLPAALTSDRGLFGRAIVALKQMGAHTGGYRAANLLVFCLAWPVLTYGLWGVAIVQRYRLSRWRRGQR